jgi:hypothetical protein
MNINFQEKYKNYTNHELLQITQNPQDYQEGAVLAANTILQERNYSAEEPLEDQEHYLTDFEKNHTGVDDRMENLKYKVSKFFKDIAAPLNPDQPLKYINLIALIAIWISILKVYIALINLLKINDYNLSINYFFLIYLIINIAILIAGIYYFLKHDRIGWIFLCLVFSIAAIDFLFDIGYSYVKMHNFSIASYIMNKKLFILSTVSVVVLLFKNDVIYYYDISKKIILNTITVSLVIFLTMLLYNFYLS